MQFRKRTRTAACVGLGLAFLASSAAADGVQARLSATSREHEPVFAGEPVHGTFFVENIGSRAFRVGNVKATCACTTAVKTKGTVEPGEKAEIQYDMQSAAPLRRSVGVYVQTNPPLDKPLRFTAAGTWKPVIAMGESAATIATDFGKPIEHRAALLRAPGVEGLRITAATTRRRDYEVALENPPPDSDAVAILVIRSVKSIQPGSRKLAISVAYDWRVPGKQNLTLDVEVHTDFEVLPNPLVVPVSSEKPRPTAVLTVRNTKGAPFVVKSVKSERCPILRPKLPETEASEQELSVTFDFTGRPVPRRAQLLLDLGKENGVLAANVHFAAPRARR